MLSDEKIIDMARANGVNATRLSAVIDLCRAVERAAREAERERIAKHFDEWDFIDTAKTIRALREGS